MNEIHIGIIGGSGLYQMPGLEDVREHKVNTPFGKTSDAVLTGRLNGCNVAFLARHGRSHSLLPSEIPYRSNIFAMKQLGVKYLVSISAIGSLQEEIRPLDIVIPDQFIDLTRLRKNTFFGDGAIAHVSMAEPVCPKLCCLLIDASKQVIAKNDSKIAVHERGTYVCIEGPHFSSKAESNLFRSMGGDVIGMTNMPEAKLAKEAQIAYATIGMVTDYDCWRKNENVVSADAAIANLKKNALLAQSVLQKAIRLITENMPSSDFHCSLKCALVTPFDCIEGKQKDVIKILIK